jgi:hypothetical protein
MKITNWETNYSAGSVLFSGFPKRGKRTSRGRDREMAGKALEIQG